MRSRRGTNKTLEPACSEIRFSQLQFSTMVSYHESRRTLLRGLGTGTTSLLIGLTIGSAVEARSNRFRRFDIGGRTIEDVINGLEKTRTHQELTQLLSDYAESDVADLFTLYDALGGDSLLEDYQYSLGEVLQ